MTVTLLGATEIRRLAAELDVTPTKKLGQNFVTDANTVRKIVAAARVQPDERVVEVGPGLGSLTLAILETGASVTAVEIDHRLAARLAQTAAEHGVEGNAARKTSVAARSRSWMPRSTSAARCSARRCPGSSAARLWHPRCLSPRASHRRLGGKTSRSRTISASRSRPLRPTYSLTMSLPPSNLAP
jgi:hypothetical protein